MNTHDLTRIYEQLRNRYPLSLTSTLAVDDGFTIDTPIIVGQANGIAFWLYDDGDMLVFSVEAPGKSHHNHWHPQSVEEAIQDVIDFMESK